MQNYNGSRAADTVKADMQVRPSWNGETQPKGAGAMATVQRIDKNLIESVMKDDIGWKRYFVDADGDFVIDFAEEGKCPELRMWLTMSGPEKEIFGISIFGRA